MYTLPQKVLELTPYAPIVGEMRIRMDANESCFPLPEELRAGVRSRLEGVELRRYPDPYAVECCRLAARYYGVREDQIVAGSGLDEILSLLSYTLLPKGAKAAFFREDFSMYAFYNALAELTPVALGKRADLTVDVEGTAAAICREGAEMFVFSNPCNPTSLLLGSGEVERLIRSVPALVVVDEAYMEFSGDSVLGLIDRYENLLVLRTCSKAVGLAGARLGFAMGNTRLITALKAVKSPYNVNALTQAAAAAVLSKPEYIDRCAQEMASFTRALAEEIRRIGGEYPAHIGKVYDTRTNFVYLEAPRSAEISSRLAQQGIAVRRMEGHLRVSTGLPEENAQFLAALREIFSSL